MISRSQCLSMPQMQGYVYQASQKQNNGERKTRQRNGKQALKTIIYFILILDLLISQSYQNLRQS